MGGSHTDEVSTKLPADIVDQRIDWAALMTLPLAAGSNATFTVYDPWDGISPISAHVGEAEEARVPAGTFKALRVRYRIAKGKRSVEQYEIWVSEDVPRFLIREDFPNGATTRLVRIVE